jgi:thiamine-phosphate diphosphorylase
MDQRTLREKLSLYLVADPGQTSGDFLAAVEAALSRGVTAVQLRAKGISDRKMLALARDLAARCRASDALFLVNDRVDVALAAGAAGVHLGVDDLPLEAARQLLGPAAVIGFSPETDVQTRTARERGADYLGVGPVVATSSKGDAGPPIGLDGLRRRVELAGIPVIGIGGITPAIYSDVLATGAAGAAVIGAILRAADPGEAARSSLRSRPVAVPDGR